MIASESAIQNAAAGTLPDLSSRHAELLDAFIAARLNVLAFAAEAKLSSRELAAFAANPAVQAHIDAIVTLETKSLHVRAIQARHKTIIKLEFLADMAEDQVEQRRACTQLLRATSSQITGSCAPSRGDEPPRNADNLLFPEPFARPEHHLSAKRLGNLLIYGLKLQPYVNPAKHKARALATFAAHFDHGATVNGKLIAADDDDECHEDLEASALGEACNAYYCRELPHSHIADTTARFILQLVHGYPEEASARRTQLTFCLERKPHSRYPDKWLITSITTEPYVRPPNAPLNTT